MQTLKAEAITLLTLYETYNKAYVIPNYQRPFAWDTRKAEELLNAVLEDSGESEKLTSLGTLLFNKLLASDLFSNNTEASLAPTTMWEVVDGQQRLTVFAIIGHALNERFKALTAGGGLVYSPPLEFDLLFATSRRRTGSSVPVLIRYGDNYDTGLKSDLAKILNSFAHPTNSPIDVGSQLLETRKAIVNWTNENLINTNFAKFSDHFLSKCIVVQVLTADEDTAFTMFEALNSTSEPLTALEVYRSKAVTLLNAQFPKTELLLAYNESKRDDVISRSNTLIFSMAQVNSGDRPRINFVPLKHYLDSNLNPQFIAYFEEASEFLRTIWFEQKATEDWFDDEAKTCVRFLKMSHDIVIPLLLRYYLTNRTDLGKVLKIVVGFYSLWRAAYPTNALPKIYRALFSKGSVDDLSIASGNPIKSVPDLATYFKNKLTDKIGVLANGQTIEQKWLGETNLNYGDHKTLCRLFIFINIGETIKSNFVPDDPWKSKVDDVEHIHSIAREPVPANVDRIGNLTFLPTKVNKSLKDAPWQEKREVYELLASTLRGTAPDNYASTGAAVPKGAKEFINSDDSPALPHLANLASNMTWGETEISDRSVGMLVRVWEVFYNSWLNP
jgi:hypothetical protein